MTAPARVVLVTVTYGDRGALLAETVRRAVRGGVQEVVVISNGADEATKTALECVERPAQVPVRWIGLPVNTGSAAGFAAAIEAARRTDADLVWILDDDNWVDEECLARAVESIALLAEQHPCSAVMCVREAELAALRAGAAVDELRPPAGDFCGVDVLVRVRGRLRRRRRGLPAPVPRRVQVRYGPYGGLLIPREALGLTAGPDQRFVLYSDDYDWTLRLHRAGVRFVLDTEAVVHEAVHRWGEEDAAGHFNAMVTTADRSRAYFSLRNSVRFSVSSTRGAGQRARLLLNAAALSAWVVASAVRRGSPGFVALYGRAVLDGLGNTWTTSFRLPGNIRALEDAAVAIR